MRRGVRCYLDRTRGSSCTRVQIAGPQPVGCTNSIAVTPRATARLLDRTAQSTSELRVTEPVSAGGPHEIEVILAALANGEYLLELTASREAGHAQELVAFSVAR
jgi:hypothetical protein